MHSESVAVQKVKELEAKHKECQHSESMLEQKVKELEEKKQRQGNEHSDALRVATPTVGKGCMGDESISETESRILRSSNSINRPMVSQGSIHQKGAESLHEIKRKWSSVKYGIPLCPYCTQPFSVQGNKFVRESAKFSSGRSTIAGQVFNGFSRSSGKGKPLLQQLLMLKPK